jgi:glyoxylase-like metal-dependent hydrolase (beta-lactamase superfamily II)
MADTQTPQSHADWLRTLQQLQALKPKVVVPGHYAEGAVLDASALRFTADYIRAFDVETAKAKDSAALVKAMQARYPQLAGVASLELSAKVAKGEMQWP